MFSVFVVISTACLHVARGQKGVLQIYVSG